MFDEKQMKRKRSKWFPKKRDQEQQVVWFDESSKGTREWNKRFGPRREKPTKPKVESSTRDIHPLADYVEGVYQLRNNSGYLDIFQVTTKDLYAQNEQDTDLDVYTFERLIRANSEDMKIIGLTYPVDTGGQQGHLIRKRDRATDPIQIQFLQQKIDELAYLQANRTNKEFFLFIFGETRQILQERVKVAKNLTSVSFPLQELTKSKRDNLLYKLGNQNSKLAMR
ncbi:hypothetical protein MKX54_20125 [Alkalihalobacillus sp. FSL R5-0424]